MLKGPWWVYPFLKNLKESCSDLSCGNLMRNWCWSTPQSYVLRVLWGCYGRPCLHSWACCSTVHYNVDLFQPRSCGWMLRPAESQAPKFQICSTQVSHLNLFRRFGVHPHSTGLSRRRHRSGPELDTQRCRPRSWREDVIPSISHPFDQGRVVSVILLTFRSYFGPLYNLGRDPYISLKLFMTLWYFVPLHVCSLLATVYVEFPP